MVALPAIPYLPRLHAFLDPGQATTYMRVFGLALLIQWFIPYTSYLASWDIFGRTFWSLLAGIAFTVIGFLPALNEMVNERLRFLIAYGAGLVGVLWSFSFIPSFQLTGFGSLGLVATSVGLFQWARNGYSPLARTLTWVGVVCFALGLFIPIGGFAYISLLFKFGSGFFGILASILNIVFTLAFLAILVFLVMNVLLQAEKAKHEEVERFASLIFSSAIVFNLLNSLAAGPGMSAGLHNVVVMGSFLWLTIWGNVCFLEAQARGDNPFKI